MCSLQHARHPRVFPIVPLKGAWRSRSVVALALDRSLRFTSLLCAVGAISIIEVPAANALDRSETSLDVAALSIVSDTLKLVSPHNSQSVRLESPLGNISAALNGARVDAARRAEGVPARLRPLAADIYLAMRVAHDKLDPISDSWPSNLQQLNSMATCRGLLAAAHVVGDRRLRQADADDPSALGLALDDLESLTSEIAYQLGSSVARNRYAPSAKPTDAALEALVDISATNSTRVDPTSHIPASLIEESIGSASERALFMLRVGIARAIVDWQKSNPEARSMKADALAVANGLVDDQQASYMSWSTRQCRRLTRSDRQPLFLVDITQEAIKDMKHAPGDPVPITLMYRNPTSKRMEVEPLVLVIASPPGSMQDARKRVDQKILEASAFTLLIPPRGSQKKRVVLHEPALEVGWTLDVLINPHDDNALIAGRFLDSDTPFDTCVGRLAAAANKGALTGIAQALLYFGSDAATDFKTVNAESREGDEPYIGVATRLQFPGAKTLLARGMPGHSAAEVEATYYRGKSKAKALAAFRRAVQQVTASCGKISTANTSTLDDLPYFEDSLFGPDAELKVWILNVKEDAEYVTQLRIGRQMFSLELPWNR